MSDKAKHLEILTEEQLRLLKLLRSFRKSYYLVGGTAIALQLGHRRSIDFDLFSPTKFDNQRLVAKIKAGATLEKVFISSQNELTMVVSGVKWTFYTYPFAIASPVITDFAQMPTLLTLAAMKVFALGGRGKWKDYVDLYFLCQQIPLVTILNTASDLFPGAINQKLARAQLSYFDDISYREPVEFMPGFEVADDVVKAELTKIALE